MTEKVRLPLGDRMVDVEVGTEAECEQAQFCICASADFDAMSPFTDNVHTTCAGCGKAIIHRPYAPKAPPKLCVVCAAAWAQAGRA